MTYTDCPVMKKVEQDNFEMFVAVHNPSTQQLTTTRIPVPNGKYEVEAFNPELKNWQAADSTIDCHLNNALQLQQVTNCHLNIDATIASHDVGLMKVKYTASK